MPLYRLRTQSVEALPSASFVELGIKERVDLQRVLKANVSVVAPDCLVLGEEFSQWEDSKRRIDLLALDRQANLVVIELKRDEEGGHMELQGLRYAAMVSTMTFQDAVETHAQFLKQQGSTEDAEASILKFLGWSSPEDAPFAQDVRVVLASANFSRELTTTVMWLNERDLDIRCVRIRPYRLGAEVVLDVQQVIPLPEAEEYQVQLRQKVREERAKKESYRDFTRYDLQIGAEHYQRLPKREFVFRVVQHAIRRGAKPMDICTTVQRSAERLWRQASGLLQSEEFIAAISDQAVDEGKQFNADRFFTEPDEIFHVDGKTYAFTNQWGGPRVLQTVDALIAKYGGGEVSYKPSAEELM
jgi:hypothetical protein